MASDRLMRMLETAQQAVARMLTGKKVRVVFDQEEGAFCDKNNVIHLPPLGELTPEATALLRGYLDHETGHVAYTDWSSFNKTNAVGIKHNYMNAIEDSRVDVLTSKRALGVARNLEFLDRHIIYDYGSIEKLNECPDPKVRALASVGTLLNFQHSPLLPDVEKKLDAVNEDIFRDFVALLESEIGMVTTRRNTQEVWDLVDRIIEKLDDYLEKQEQKEQGEGEGEEGEGDGSGSGQSDEEPKDGDGQPGDSGSDKGDSPKDKKKDKGKDKKKDKKGKSPEKDKGKKDKKGKGKKDKGKGIDSKDAKKRNATKEEEEQAGKGDGEDGEDEKSEARQMLEGSIEGEMPPYTKNEIVSGIIDEIVRVQNQTGDFRPYTDGDIEFEMWKDNVSQQALEYGSGNDHLTYGYENYDRNVKALKRQINVMRAKLLIDLLSREKKWKDNQDSGILNDKQLYTVPLGNANVFRRRRKQFDINTAVTLLVDCSGSMSGDKLKMACDTAIVLSETFNLVDIPFEVLGYTQTGGYGGYGHSDLTNLGYTRTAPLSEYVYKEFDQKMTQRTKGAIGCMPLVNTGSTPESEALRWAAKRLLARTERRKVLIDICDGSPCAYAQFDIIEDMKKITGLIEGSGEIELFGIGIMTDAPKEFYSNSCQIDRIEDIVTTVYAKLSTFLRGKKRQHVANAGT